MRRVVAAIGCVVAAFGALFLLQGLNVVRWPADSFMLGRQAWVDRGAVVAALGLGLILASRRLPR